MSMDENNFWQIINNISTSSSEEKERLLKESLMKLTPEDIILFQEIWDKKMLASYTWDLWGAAYIIGGGCSDDSFNDFRASLILKGKNIYDMAITNPDNIANIISDIDNEEWFYEGYQYVANDVYTEKINNEIPPSNIIFPEQPNGVSWSEDELEDRLPNLYEKINN